MTQTFAALQTRSDGERYVTSLVQRQLDDLPEGEVLVRVQWSSLNYKDALSATGNKGVTRQYPHTPGIDAAGEVVSDSSGTFAEGAGVIVTGYDLGMNTAGGYGEYIRVPAAWVTRLPQGMDARTAMLFGTAGLTAGLCVEALLDNGVTPEDGEVLVTGATGGVGSLAVALLAHLGFRVVAGSGKAEAADWLTALGAISRVSREEMLAGAERPMLKPRWAGVVDTVGGEPLANAIKSTVYGGSVACCGLAASTALPLTVLPFILRNVSLLGVDSVEPPLAVKAAIWQRLATDWRLPVLEQILAAEVTLADLPPWFDTILAGGMRGRILVRLS
ncbi:YhdH/YhfP family quinone oxidoreductase [Alcanivorax sp. JB21]|uniref:YhdH/YhfP family quinone oxidoreductase n=1 Tax=Alcanivorax limicola TaxID=2874102 RepID=UPI001CBEEABA|nr:YhdH/YhfP family quinone oxidoreductase [Alcanivorax limicola]MBZ2187976.1 YhdH/YhfP family quinone oxidoreductase [Alcanivorax limicola]